MEAKDQLCAVLETVIALKEKFKAEYVIDVLLGKETSQVLSYQHEDLEVFGSGQGEDERTWNAVIRQALIAGYIDKDIENYGLLKVTKAGHAFLKNPVSFKIVKDVDFEEVEEEVPMKGGASCAVDPELYSILKDLRKKIAKRLELPPYVIFQDPSLEAMATTYPITLEELQNIPGVGAGKAKRYGEEFIKVIKAHVEENEIERPEDLRVRTVANKSKLKVSIIQAIDRKIALDELAESKGLDFGNVSVVGILSADSLMNFPDFRAHERAFQLMLQVSGRTGRRDKQGTVILQTSQPEHPLIRMVIRSAYREMVDWQLSERSIFHYPPYFRLIVLVLRSKNESVLQDLARTYADKLRSQLGNRVLGPVTPPVSYVQTLHIRKIVIKIETAAAIQPMRGFLESVYLEMQHFPTFRQIMLHYDVDPL